MFKNYFKTALRHFWRHKFFSLINIAGLSIGISASLVIYLLVSFDFSFDKFEKDGDRIYRIVSHFTYSGVGNKTAGVPYPMADAVRNELTGIEAIAPLRTWQGGYRGLKVTIPGQNGQMAIFRKQEQVVFADDNYFNLVSYKWIAGSSRSSLRQPYQVVLTQSNAGLYFPRLTAGEIIGRSIWFNDSIHATVTGVVNDIADHTDFAFKTFVSYSSLSTAQLKPEAWDYWGSTDPAEQVFIKLLPGTSSGNINVQLAKLAAKYHKGEDARITTAHLLQPLNDMHFNASYGNFNGRVASKPTLYGLLAVAAFLLFLAAINFINLTTAQASQRAKEIGIRKTIGSSRKQLMLQFLCETFLLTLLSTLLSIALAPFLLKIFSGFVPAGVSFDLFEQGGILMALGVLVILVSLLAGIYPAAVLSSFKPVLILKKHISTGGTGRGILLRKTLITAQFVIAQVFIIATIVVSRQIDYSLSADMGFAKDAIIYFDTNYGDTEAHRVILRDKINAMPGVSMVSRSNTPASYSGGMRGDILVYRDGRKEINTSIAIKLGDTNYIKLYKIKLLAGGNLPASDTINSLLINETYARALGFTNPEQAIGKRLYWSWVNRDVPIVGVIQDFHMRSLRETIKPLAIASRASEHLTFNIALSGGSGTWPSTISKIQKAFKQVYPEDNWNYHFIDETIANYYKAEQYTSTLLKWATFLSIFISCLGLAGVALYITNQRQKEIGIRKVMGATVTQLLVLLSTDFLLFIGIAFVITVPAAWWWAHSWLQDFAYKTALSWKIFVMAGVFMGMIALLTISVQTIRAALANPVKSLSVE